MRMRRNDWLVVALGAVLLAGPLVDDAFARRPRTRLSATANGRRLKALRRATFLLYATTSFSVNGQTRVRRGLSRAITANCPGDLKTLVLPAVVSCYGSYTEARRTGAKEWSRNDGILVTIESLVDNRAVGSFSGAFDPGPSHAVDPPVTVESGSFAIVLTEVGV